MSFVNRERHSSVSFVTLRSTANSIMDLHEEKSSDVNSATKDSVATNDQGDNTQWKQVASTMSKLSQQISNLDIKLSTEMSQIRSDIMDLRESVDSAMHLASDASTKVSGLEKQVKDLDGKFNEIKIENSKLNLELNTVKEKCIRMECQSRRDNLLLDGVPESAGENPMTVLCDILENTLEIHNVSQIKVVRCHRLGPRTAGRNRAIIFKMHWYGDRERIWAARSKLKGSPYTLKEDFPLEIQDRRQVLYPIFLEARKQNKQPKLVVDKLYIDGSTFTINNLDKLPSELRPEVVSSPVLNDDLQAFFHGQSPLSNFHISPFTVMNDTFHSVEQYFQYNKASAAKDEISMFNIMQAPTPRKCKEIGDRVKLFDSNIWEKECKTVMYNGCLSKFQQNPKLRDFLLKTGTRTLVEASSRDLYWGAGLSLRNPNLKNPSLWRGKNNLGEVLMEVRQALR